MSFFEEDDEPTTRVRPRRPATARGGRPDAQQLLVRRLLLFGGIALIVILLLFVVRSCQQSAKENALRDYSREVGTLVSASDEQVGQPLFNVMRDPTQGDLSTQINGLQGTADQQFDQAKAISAPDEMVPAQRSLLIAMEMRRDGLRSIASRVRTALSSDGDAADEAIEQIAGAMQLFLASDVVYASRVLPLMDSALRDADVRQQLQRSQFFPGREWLDPGVVADTLGQQLSGGGGGGNGGEPLPGLHGTGIDDVQVGDLTLQQGDVPNRITYSADTEFSVNFTNQGEHDEADIDVVLTIEGGPKPIKVRRTIPTVATGATATAALSLPSDPPLETPVTITVEVKPVPGEEKKDNNTAEFEAAFFRG